MVRLGTAAILASTVALVTAQYALSVRQLTTSTSSAPCTTQPLQTPACLMPCYASSLTASGTTCWSSDIKCLCQDFGYQVATARCFKDKCANLTDTETASSIGIMSCASAGIIVNQAALSSALASSTAASSTAAASKTETSAASTTAAATSGAVSSAASSDASSAASSAASAATSSAASVGTSTAVSTTAVASVITSAAASATSTRAASSVDKVVVTGALGFVAGLLALLA
ncbi:BQ5605_C021g09317 [Microbotryum silenes-dioicae]|uniref:BQ5605_C021g09317 protein n=1 Tax=Microbotryum silenes-dioicae TaxID=796604 RepID=A0A2X0MNI7_9BASI|nr:BQ5605_C021g09317 [Microbotryum silenes-dioicae]